MVSTFPIVVIRFRSCVLPVVVQSYAVGIEYMPEILSFVSFIIVQFHYVHK